MNTSKNKTKDTLKHLASIFLGLTLGFWLFACEGSETDVTPDTPTSPNAVKIMALGASRVEGARPVFESYRYELWKLMTDQNWDIDLVGTMEDESTYPAYSGKRFDNDHEGRSGWTSSQIRSGINDWLSQGGAPDIVLFSSPGGNDGLTGASYSNAVNNVNAIIDALQAANPNVTIIIEQMAPAHSRSQTQQLDEFMRQMNAEVVNIASAQSTASSKVLTVDMNTGFNDDLLADDVHYNEAGARFIAQRYFQVLSTLIN